MKKFLILIFAILLQCNLYPQKDYKTINLSPNLKVIKIYGNAYVHVSYDDIPQYGRVGANGLIFVNGKKAFLFDTPWTNALTKDLYAWIADSMGLKLAGFVPNHWHVDCMGGLGFLQKQKVESYANQMTIDIAKSKNLPIPEHGFKDSFQLKLGNKIIECYYLGAAHTLDNIVVWIPSEKILFAGCMVKSLNSKNLGNTTDGDLKAYPKTIKKLLTKFQNAKIVIPGHGKFGSMELVKHTLYLTGLVKNN